MSDDVLARCAVVGAGRLGTAITRALPDLAGPFGRGFDGTGHDIVLLCVPDGQIAQVARAIRPGPLVGHCSGATALDVLTPHERFTLHPMMTVRGRTSGQLAGAGCTVAGSTARALDTAEALAAALGMTSARLAEDDRPLYHAAASFAANFLVTLEGCAERLLEDTGVPREFLVPLVRAAVDNWAEAGPERALTGPVARGDVETVHAQRTAVAERAPDLLPLFDVLTERTRALAATSREVLA